MKLTSIFNCFRPRGDELEEASANAGGTRNDDTLPRRTFLCVPIGRSRQRRQPLPSNLSTPSVPRIAADGRPPVATPPDRTTTTTTPPTVTIPTVGTDAREAEDFESIHSVMYVPPAESETAPCLPPGSVVELAEVNPSESSLEIGLIQRASNRDPEVCRVLMRETKTIDVAPGQRREMFTFGLGGCIAVSIVSKQRDGTVSATMSHRPPEELATQLQEIEQELVRHSPHDPAIDREILVLMPGGYKETDGKMELKPALTEELAQLLQIFDGKFPGTIPTRVTYHPNRPNERSDALVIDFPAKAEDPILYKGIHNGACKL